MDDYVRNTYEILAKIGQGSCGAVYKARHKNLNKFVVFKEILSKNKRLTNQETEILKDLHHQYIPQVYDLINYKGHTFSVMDFIPGKDFDQLMKEGHHFDQAHIEKYAKQICQALDYMHSRKTPILHCDIKPANIMLTPDDYVVLIDFNVSVFLDGKTALLGYTNTYASPEQIEYSRTKGKTNVKIDGRSDIYSLGATLYKIITGSRLNGKTSTTTSSSTGLDGAIPLEPANYNLLCNYVSEGLASIIVKATEPDPNKRFSSAAEMYKAIDEIYKTDKNYKRMIKLHRTVQVMLAAGMALGIVLMGKGVYDGKVNKVDEYNALVEKQIRYIEESKFDEENETFEEAVELKKNEAGAYLQHAKSLYEQELYDDCIDFINYDIFENDNLDIEEKEAAELYYIGARCYYEQEEYNSAIKQYETLLDLVDDNPIYYRDYALALAYANNHDEAKAQLDTAIEKGLEKDSIYYTNGELNMLDDDYSDAIDNFNNCIDITDDQELKERSYVFISDIYRNTRAGSLYSLANARSTLIEALGALDQNRQIIALERLIQVDIDLSNYDEALTYLQQVENNGWATEQTYDNYVVIYTKKQDTANAYQYLSTMVDKYGESYKTNMRYAYLEILTQQAKDQDDRDFSQFEVYYNNAISMYQGKGTDDELELLKQEYRDLVSKGWL